MTGIAHSARGAAAFTQAGYYLTGSLDEGVPLSLDHCSEPAQTWSQLIDELLAIRNLDDDWDGQGAKAPPQAVVDGAITLAQYFRANGIDPADFAIAGVNGTIFFEWHDPSGFLEIEVAAPGEAEGRLVRRGSDVAEVFTLSRHS